MVLLENVNVNELKLENFKDFKCPCELCDDGQVIFKNDSNAIHKLTGRFIYGNKGALIDENKRIMRIVNDIMKKRT